MHKKVCTEISSSVRERERETERERDEVVQTVDTNIFCNDARPKEKRCNVIRSKETFAEREKGHIKRLEVEN